ncbi:MAG: DsbA family protein [Pseudomonadota bacterium]
MKLKTFLLLAVVALSASGATAQGLNQEQQSEVRELIREHLVENPEILEEAFEALQGRQQAVAAQARQDAIAELGNALRHAGDDPIGGNPEGKITVVEFFDYNCPFCRRVKPEVMELLESDDRIRYVFKEFPILSASSAQAARVALAIWALAPTAYWDAHNALMAHDGTLTEDDIRAVVVDAGLDWDEVAARGDEDDITEKIRQTLEIAQRLQINGTPSFVIGDEIIPGFVEAEQLEAAVAAIDG